MEGKQERKREEEEDDDKSGENNKKEEEKQELPLMTLNHVSRLCKSVKDSIDFYTKVLGFVVIERPQAFDTFDGAWLFNYGVGIHLVQTQDEDRLPAVKEDLDPMDNHISFQCEDMEAVEQKLKDHNVKYIKRAVEDDEHDTTIDQLFFNDPDGFMIEMCNCENIKLIPAGSMGKIQLPTDHHTPPVELRNHDRHTNEEPKANTN